MWDRVSERGRKGQLPLPESVAPSFLQSVDEGAEGACVANEHEAKHMRIITSFIVIAAKA